VDPREKHPSAEINYITRDGVTTHVVMPVEEYERLVKNQMTIEAVSILEGNKGPWINADDFALELAGEWIAKARKAAGLTQKQLGDKLKLPQSMISRIERNPDRTTVRTIRKIAKALGVDVSSLIR